MLPSKQSSSPTGPSTVFIQMSIHNLEREARWLYSFKLECVESIIKANTMFSNINTALLATLDQLPKWFLKSNSMKVETH